MRYLLILLTLLASHLPVGTVYGQPAEEPRKVDGYRGIWFGLGQESAYGDKYSGGLGTYTANHLPTAVFAPEVNKTFFVYGGTTAADERHLLAMVSFYDHERHVVPRPTVVHDKQGVDDPHDNPSLSIDEEGHLWVFVSGRARARPGFVYRSERPYDVEAFELIRQDEFAYPQPWWVRGNGFMFLYTRYTRGRELYWRTSPDGRTWSGEEKLVEGGHYEVSARSGTRIGTSFNVHIPHDNVDTRTNLYFLQTDDMGRTWYTADGRAVDPPLPDIDNPALVRDYRSEGRLVYLNDMAFDGEGHPVILYITSTDFRPGPSVAPRMWMVAHWTGQEWAFHEVTETTHNYDVGSIYVEDDGTWRIIGPTEAGPQYWGTGGEMAVWTSRDEGETWAKLRDVTRNSARNHSYARRPVNAHDDFYAFWADGHADEPSVSRLYFTNRTGDRVWLLPYAMEAEYAAPEQWDRRRPASDHFELVELAEGVWAAAHRNRGYAISNAGIVDLGDRTLIFDTFMTPQAAADLREAAELLTGRPPALVVNSHYHNDHIRGNQVFLPEAKIVATSFTRDAIAAEEPEQIAHESVRVPELLEEMDRSEENPAEGSELRMWRDYYEGMLASHPVLQTTLPTLTFVDSLTIHGPERDVVLKATGRGHTEDDVVMHLPAEGIVFMGDLHFVERHPWLGDGFPRDWVQTLRRVHGWGVDTVVPGHWPVSSSESLLTMAGYIESLTDLVRRHREAGGSLDELATVPIPDRYEAWWYGRFFAPNLRALYEAIEESSGNTTTR